MIKVRSPPSNYVINMYSSAKDQLTGSSVAIKKIMKPFSTPVLSKRTYRELKLLKHIQHENVSIKMNKLSYWSNNSFGPIVDYKS